jgi:hypothetical protein
VVRSTIQRQMPGARGEVAYGRKWRAPGKGAERRETQQAEKGSAPDSELCPAPRWHDDFLESRFRAGGVKFFIDMP